MIPVLIVCVGTAMVFPAFFYPFSKTLWVAVELAMSPLQPGEVTPPWGPPAGSGQRGSTA
ncbi:MAG: hypothetical protein U5R31_16320 [Acidimicrobiia bacterium]|nr:hypothetical protein [Acidimicrobiia bacterium]